MDKFAIDLDQVLNDFEYSELTDQYNASRNIDTQTSTSSNHNNVTKHSINNVFHSLNEYLNTNINVADVSQVENISKESAHSSLVLKPSSVKNYVSTNDKDTSVSYSSENEEKFYSNKNEVRTIPNNSVEIEKIEDASNGTEKIPVDLGPETEKETYDGFKEEKFIDETKDETTKKDFYISSDNFMESNTLVEIPSESNIGGLEVTVENNKSILCEERIIAPDDKTKTKNSEESHQVGFTDDLNLDDSDLNKLLAEFENELALHNDYIQDHLSVPNVSKSDVLGICNDALGNKKDAMEGYNNEPKVQELCLEVHEGNDFQEVQNNYLKSHNFQVRRDDEEVYDNNHTVQESDLKVPSVEFEVQKEDQKVYDNHHAGQKSELKMLEDDKNISIHKVHEENLNNSEDNLEDDENELELHKELPEVHEDCSKIHPDKINVKQNNLVCESDMKVHEDILKNTDVEICEDNTKDCGNNESQEISKIDFKEINETKVSVFAEGDQNKEFEEDNNAKINVDKGTIDEKQICPAEDTISESDITTNAEDSKGTELVCPPVLNTKPPEVEQAGIRVLENTGDNESVLEDCEKEDCKNETTKMGGGDTLPEHFQSIGEEKKLQESLDSTCRPQNLSLKGSDGDSQREINLIGGPGSTPYNNVYVNEEIQKISTVDSDTDSSTSSTNTFSDASSIASTASTEEMKDDNEVVKNVICANVDDTALAIENLKINNDVAGESSFAGLNYVEESVGAGKIENEPQKNSETVTESNENREVVENEQSEPVAEVDLSGASGEKQWLGKEAPLWIPDSDTTSCLHCDMKFTVLKRRHHCRACGLVLCSKCCSLRFKLEYLDAEARVCNKCHDILNKDSNSSSSSDLTPDSGNSPHHRPNPNNPLEYCSTISPLQQVGSSSSNPPAIMVPVGVLKRKGSNKGKSNKSVMFCDGIRPGSDLTNLDNDFNYNNTKTRKLEKNSTSAGKINRNLPIIDSETNTFIPKSENSLPPLITVSKTDVSYTDCSNNPSIVDILKHSQRTFAVHLSLSVHVKIIDMSCCINKMAWCFCTDGMINVGQDEIVILLEYIDEESFVPKDVFYHINNVYTDAVKGTSIKEMGLSLHNSANFLDSKNHAGFVYIRPTFQCVENIIKPNDPYLIGILIHRWETPWAKLFPLRLVLRLGAEYRYYPSPIISTRHRDSVFVEIGHTIINLLADFRNFSYTLPQIRGLTIHMEDKNTTVTIPINRYDQVIKSLNNTSDHILAFAGVFSQQADSHLVCIQDTQGNDNCYSTHAINIHNKPRKVTGASFIVFNGALKSSSGLTAKSNIVEDGLMIQVMPEHMQQIRDKLRAMKDHTIHCGCVNADSDETVNIVWGDNDVNFNVGVTSSIDGMSLSGIPSIRVHNGKNHVCVNGNRIIRWTEVFIIQNGEDNPKNQDPVDVSRLSESIAKATCDALVKYLDLLLTNNCHKLGIRVTLQEDNVSYFAGSNGTKLAPIYMKSLDDELIPVLHRITSNDLRESAIVLELIFRILNV